MNAIGTNTVKNLQTFFLILKNLELRKAQFVILQNTKNAFTFHKRTNCKLFDFHKKVFNMSKNEIMQFLNLVLIPQLRENQSRDCEFILSEKVLLLILKSMSNNKWPGNDGLTKEFYKVFWENLKTSLMSSFKSVFDKGELSNSQSKR